MAEDKGKARKYAQGKTEAYKKETVRRADRKANTFNQSILGPVGNETAKAGIKAGKTLAKGIGTTQRLSQKALNKTAKQVAGDVKNMAQFGSKAAQEVVKDVQGLAKMVMKGFGN